MTRSTVFATLSTVGFAALALVSFIFFVLLAPEGDTNIVLSTDAEHLQLPALVLPVLGIGIVATVLLAAVTVWHAIRTRTGKVTSGPPIAVGIAVFVAAFLASTAVGSSIPVAGLLIGALGLSVPLVFGALGGVISERVGVVNVAIEGQLLGAAFSAAVITSVTGSPYAGLIAAMASGAVVALALALFAVRYAVDQVVVGIVLNVLVTGLTSFFYAKVLSEDPSALNSPTRFAVIPIPVLSEIPVLGPVLFRQTIIVYLMYFAVVGVWFALFRTRWGLRVRAVGEHPQAADTVGIRVNPTRVATLAIAGAIVGLGGAYFTLSSVGAFNREMTAGAGFIALAAVISGRWDPIRATIAALLFGFAWNLQSVLGILGSPIPGELLLMLPYLATIVAVAGLVGHVQGPAAAGKPYLKS
jgi:simple sugar transport system permease protein